MVEQIETRCKDIIVVLMVGIPASGKSTLARALQAEQCSGSTLVLSLDDIQTELIVAAQQQQHDQIQMPQQQQIDQQTEHPINIQAWHDSKSVALQRCREIITSNTYSLLIVDDTFEYGSMRKVYYQLCRELQVKYLELHIKCPLDVALANNRIRNSLPQAQAALFQITDQAITNVDQRMQASQYPLSNVTVHWAELQSINQVANPQISKIRSISETIFAQAKIPEEIATQDQHIELTQNQKHMLDQQIRKEISQLLKTRPDLRKHAQKMSQIKKEVLFEASGSQEGLMQSFKLKIESLE